MRGFIYLIEIAVAAIIMTLVLSVFLSVKVKQDWQKADLVEYGNNILSNIKNKQNYFLDILNENLTEIDFSKPENVNYGLEIDGSPKSKITVGCVDYCDYIQNILTPVYVNGREIIFTVAQFDIANEIPNYIDAIVFVNYTDYTAQKTKIKDFIARGGAVIGINATLVNNANFNDIFGLVVT